MELPGWNFEENYNLSTNRRSTRPQDDELVELLWRDGQVVLKSQTHRDQTQSQKQNHQHQETQRSNIFLGHQETVSWIQYPPDEDPFETDDLSSRFLSAIDPFERSTTETTKHESCPDLPQVMPPPKFRSTDSSLSGNKELGMEHYSVMTVGPSHCGSNQSQNDLDVSMSDLVQRNKTKIDEKINYSKSASSSGGSSGCSFGKNIKEITITGGKNITTDRKRKSTDDQSVSQSDAMGNNKSNQRSGSTRRSRAAEVHNLSERRRRDRINERMRTLQELIPQCSKTDKASILDEAIDYLKSLQLQLQVMWMSNGMAAAATVVPMMFPGVQPPPFIHQMQMQNPVQLPRFPVMDRSAIQNNPGFVCPNPVQNQISSDRFARYIGGFPQMQAASQVGPIRQLSISSNSTSVNRRGFLIDMIILVRCRWRRSLKRRSFCSHISYLITGDGDVEIWFSGGTRKSSVCADEDHRRSSFGKLGLRATFFFFIFGLFWLLGEIIIRNL